MLLLVPHRLQPTDDAQRTSRLREGKRPQRAAGVLRAAAATPQAGELHPLQPGGRTAPPAAARAAGGEGRLPACCSCTAGGHAAGATPCGRTTPAGGWKRLPACCSCAAGAHAAGPTPGDRHRREGGGRLPKAALPSCQRSPDSIARRPASALCSRSWPAIGTQVCQVLAPSAQY